MAAVKKFLMIALVVIVLMFLGSGFVKYYSFIFSRRVVGVIQKVERIDLNVAVIPNETGKGAQLNPQLHSWAVAIKEKTSGEIVTASSEDRQWAVVQPGQCAEAVFYPYPPWQLEKANTYFGARLEKLFDCQNQ